MKESDLLTIVKKLQSEIIERKWAEKKSKDALDYAESILDSVHIPIVVIDDELKIISMNQPCYDLFNFSIAECVGKHFFQISEGIFDISAIQNLVNQNSNEPKEIELCMNLRTNSSKYLQIKCINLQYNIKHLNFKLLVFNDVTEYKNMLNEIETNSMMMKEIHHRTVNNLFMIDGILKLQLIRSKNEETKSLLEDNITRIAAISSIHKILMSTNNDFLVKINSMLAELIANIKYLNTREIKFELDIENDISIHYEKSIYLSIIINELIINSFKHAFSEIQSNPTINISIKKSETDKVSLLFYDNGDKSIDKLEIDKSLGLSYIENIVQTRLDGKWIINNNDTLCHQIIFTNLK